MRKCKLHEQYRKDCWVFVVFIYSFFLQCSTTWLKTFSSLFFGGGGRGRGREGVILCEVGALQVTFSEQTVNKHDLVVKLTLLTTSLTTPHARSIFGNPSWSLLRNIQGFQKHKTDV